MANYRGFGGDDLPDPRIILDKLKKNLKFVFLGLAIVLGVIIAFGAFFQVEPEEQAIVLRFGSPLDAPVGPGLHVKIPFVDEVLIEPVERQLRIEIGFRSEPGAVTATTEKGFDRESLMLTGDLSLAHVSWSVIYRIRDIKKYLFNVKDQEDTIRDVSMGVMRQVIGDYSLDEVLTEKFNELAAEAKVLTQKSLDEVETGVDITAIAMQKTDVPHEAKQAFDRLNQSVADVRRQIVEAYARRKQVRGEAKEAAQRTIGAAEGRRSEMVSSASGEAAAFTSKLKEYRLAPDITKQWMYLEAMAKVLTGVQEKIIVDDAAGSGTVKLLPLKDLFPSADALGARAAPEAPASHAPAAGGAR